jgi:3-hydroxyisobutyrate dehydrogenase
MLPEGRIVSEVYSHIIPNARAGTLLIDCSTTEAECARDIDRKARAAALKFADAPTLSGTAAATAGALTFVVGCALEELTSVSEVLKPVTHRMLRAGDVGAGQSAAICHAMALGVSMAGMSEACLLAEKMSIDPKAFFDAVSETAAHAWALQASCPVAGVTGRSPADRDYFGGLLTATLLKDLELAAAAGKRDGVQAPLTNSARALFHDLAGQGFGNRDFSAVIHLLRGDLASIQ